MCTRMVPNLIVLRSAQADIPDMDRGPGAAAAGPAHHYVFEIFALDTKLDIAANASDPFDTRAKVLNAMQGHIVGKAVYLGLFHRPE